MRAILSFLVFLPLAALSQQDVRLSVSARVEHDPVSELSGMVKSPGRDELYWVLNDSGDEARLFAIDAEGDMVIPTYSRFSFHGAHPEKGKAPWPGFKVLFAENQDWESMTADGKYLYIGDTGNNFNFRQDLAIYMLGEIDPRASTQAAVIRRMPVSYPEQKTFPALQWHYDSESLFSFEGKLYLITKHRRTGTFSAWEAGAKLYRLDTAYTDRDNPLTLIDSHPEVTGATGAELAPDGSRLAVVTYTDLWIFERPAQGDKWLSSGSTRIGLRRRDVGQVEAVVWDDDETVVLANEDGEIFRLALPAP